MYGRTSLYFWSSITTHVQEIIGPNGLIRLSEGARLTSTYNKDKYIVHTTAGNNVNEDIGKTTLTINGGATAGYMQFPLGIDTSEVYFSIPYNFDLILENGLYNIDYGYKLMPGASLWVKSDATLQINSGFYVYDGLVQSDMSGKSYPTTALLKQYGFSQAANFIVDGTFIVKAGKTFGGIIQTNGGGSIILEETCNLIHGEVVDGGKTSYDINSSKFALNARIFDITTASLVNLEAGNTYVGSTHEWVLEDFTVTYAKNSTINDYSVDIGVIGGKYHKWTTITTAINENMKGSWVKQ